MRLKLAVECRELTDAPPDSGEHARFYDKLKMHLLVSQPKAAGEPQPMTEDAMLSRLSALADRADAFLLSDYGYGTVTPRVFERIRTLARRTNATVPVDSRYQLVRFAGVTAATPNEAELEQLTGMPTDDERAVEKAGRQLLERLEARILLVTRGSPSRSLKCKVPASLPRPRVSTLIAIFW